MLVTTTEGMERLMERRDRLIQEKVNADREQFVSDCEVRDIERQMAEHKWGAEFEVRSAVGDDNKPKFKNEKERELAIQRALLDNEDYKELQRKLDIAKEGKWTTLRALYQIRDELHDVRSDIRTGTTWVAAALTDIGREVIDGKRNASGGRD